MQSDNFPVATNRRAFLKTVAAAGAGVVAAGLSSASESPSGMKKLKLGFDNFAVRAMN
jgi:hypothetical protein